VNHLTVDGGGTINGRGEEWWARSCKKNSTNVLLPGKLKLLFSSSLINCVTKVASKCAFAAMSSCSNG